MLQELQIQNYAIIDELVIRFDEALNIITGETGAGKSILMGALSLILGERADSSVVRNKDRKCFVEGFFHVPGKLPVMQFLSDNDLDPADELIIRREIGGNGKSRAFVNDSPVTLNQLQQLSVHLVDLHRQFDTLSLGESGFQLSVIDAMASNEANLEKYRALFRKWQECQKELLALQEQKSKENREFDYNQFLYNELKEAGFKPHEIEEIEVELKLLTDAGGIKAALEQVEYLLRGTDLPVLQVLKQLLQQVQPYRQHQPKIAEISDRIQAVNIELQDIAGEAIRINDQLGLDAGKMEELQERLNTGYKLLKKHNARQTAELLEIMDGLSNKLQAVEQLDERIAALNLACQEAKEALEKISAVLSAARLKQVAPFEKQVNALLSRVGMPNARIKVQLEKTSPGSSGADSIDFLFDANKSNQFSSLRKVASGGELSRLMLCIKSLVAGKVDLPTLIFDEIDTGISGEASRQVGLIMKELCQARQVICITHQPQIAGMANNHLFVYKQASGNAITTSIRVLNKEERIRVIAEMLGGEKPTPAALENAREMVMQ